MPFTVRDLTPADAHAVAEVRRAAAPFMVCAPEMISWEAGQAPPGQRFRHLVTESGGRVTGSVRMGLYPDNGEDGQAFANPYADPRVGEREADATASALLRAAEEYLAGIGARSVFIRVTDDGRSPARAERHGYRRLRRSGYLRLDLAGTPLPPEAEPPRGVELRPFTAFADDPRPIHALDMETVQDEPCDIPAEILSYEAWLAHEWRQPDIDHSLSTVAVADGVAVAFTLVRTDGLGRMMSGMTGTARSHRGRGLAKLTKNRALHLARAAGCTEAFTCNDAENGPMLAINKWFGYEWTAADWRYVRELREPDGREAAQSPAAAR
ncbi:GNAT family N-acetyltransferase [Streptomyces sp. I05A-00742]|uniref:GNAT family N-acetyltransferase n=1 Tax=Streptomyces sp. I05A-00742 TaxID=2732853 RepID=UPI0014886AF7|nr:GNAT family N-acetyltransferase [Streptomyces sp. I05A-00742]